MKKIDKMHKNRWLRRSSLAAIALFCCALTVSSALFADQRGLPPYSADWDESDELLEEDYVPDRIVVPRSRTTRQLPHPNRSHRSLGNYGTPVAFDSSLEPRETILPSGFLEEEPIRSGAAAPRPLKTPRPRKSVETDSYEFESYPVDSDQEYYTTSFGPYLAETEYPVAGDGGLYNEFSPALESCYLGPPVVKSFGCGWLDNLTLFGGVTGFKGELDGGSGGNFGFSEGINWSIPVMPQHCISGQFGFRAVQSNIRGSADVEKSSRNQYFVTGGFFMRDLSCPLQCGAVFDWFRDDYYEKIEVEQVRCEISTRTFSNLEYGFQGGFGTSKKSNDYFRLRENLFHNTLNVDYRLKGMNYYLVFGRKYFAGGNFGELRAGATEDGDVILSGQGEFPINDCLSLNGSFTAMIAKDGRSNNGWRRETWDVSVGVVFYFRGGACSKTCNPYRPMFDVAGNGSMIPRFTR